MLRHIPMPLLVVAAALTLTLDLALTAPVAIGETVVETAQPKEIPMEAFMTGPVVESADIDGLGVVLKADGGAFLLEVTNSGDQPTRLAALAETWVTEGSMMSRMMPMPARAASQQLDTVVPPGQTIQVKLAHKAEDGELEPGDYRSTQIALRTADGSLNKLLHEESRDFGI